MLNVATPFAKVADVSVRILLWKEPVNAMSWAADTQAATLL